MVGDVSGPDVAAVRRSSWGVVLAEEPAAGRGSPCGCAAGVWPHTWWCFSQSLCWQKEPQYLAVLQPLHVSLAFRPQFQQLCGGGSRETLVNARE